MDPLLSTQIQRFNRRGTWNRVYTNTTVVAGTYRTDLSVTGAGYLLYVATVGQAAPNQNRPQLRITIDGGTPFTIGAGTRYAPASDAGSGSTGKSFVLDAQFRVSLKIETFNPTGAGDQGMNTEVDYIVSA